MQGPPWLGGLPIYGFAGTPLSGGYVGTPLFGGHVGVPHQFSDTGQGGGPQNFSAFEGAQTSSGFGGLPQPPAIFGGVPPTSTNSGGAPQTSTNLGVSSRLSSSTPTLAQHPSMTLASIFAGLGQATQSSTRFGGLPNLSGFGGAPQQSASASATSI